MGQGLDQYFWVQSSEADAGHWLTVGAQLKDCAEVDRLIAALQANRQFLAEPPLPPAPEGNS